MQCKFYTNPKIFFIMTDKKHTNERILNLIIVDESGSMTSIYDEAFNGMNSTITNIRSQAQEISDVRQYINLITFDSDHYKQHLRHCPAEKVRLLTRNDYRPGSCTPLFDAVGRAVSRLERHTTDADAVLVTIITDGQENDSHEFDAERLKRLISRLTEKGWVFTFIGANQDVMYEAGRIGISHSMAFTADSDGTKQMWEKEMQAHTSFYGRIKARKASGLSMRQAMEEEKKETGRFFD